MAHSLHYEVHSKDDAGWIVMYDSRMRQAGRGAASDVFRAYTI